MVYIKRDDKYSIRLEFDTAGATLIKNALIAALQKEEMIIEIIKDSHVNKSTINLEHLLISVNEDVDRLKIEFNTIFLELDPDIIEYGIDRFKKCELGEDFYPAEFCEVNLQNQRVTIHALLVRE